MILEVELKNKLIEIEVEMIIISFKISDKLGEVAVESAINNFYNYMCRGLGVEKFFAPFNMEYRGFIIDLAKAIPEKLLDKAIPIILGMKNENNKRGF